MTLPKRVLEAFRRHDLVPRGSRLAVAVSGGLDSTVLLDVLLELRRALGVELVVATVDHGLRVTGSARDASFVRALANARGLPCYCGRFQAIRGQGLEEAARRERLAFLRGVPADKVALAHHRDDQAETVLLRLLRASSLAGLGAMAPARAGIIRPLLDIPREEIHAWAVQRGLRWCEDGSNRDPARERNLLRREVMPVLDGVHGGLRERLSALASEVREAAVSDSGAATTARAPCVARSALRGLGALGCGGVLIEHVSWRMGASVRLGREQRLQAVKLALDGAPGAWMPLSAGWRLAVCPRAVYCLPPPPRALSLRCAGPRLWGVHRVVVERLGDGRAPVALRAPEPGERFGGRPIREWLRTRGVPAPLRGYHPVFCVDQAPAWVPGGPPVEGRAGTRGLAITVTASIPSACAPGHLWTATL